MGKKDKSKKKGKGAEKTAEKTEKKMKSKMKKVTGEEDIESVVKAIEDEEKRRSTVKEVSIEPPSHRTNLSLVAHPENNPEIIFFGGEFYNGQKTLINNDLLIYNTKRSEWTKVLSPGGPPSRCAHQAISTAANGGQMWLFGGEYASPSETQFYHYKDLWCYHFASRRWEKMGATGGPSSRSGHRMVLTKKNLVVFGGFHDNGRESKYFNDVHALDMDKMKWKKLEVTGSGPSPRSACNMFVLPDGRVVVFGGYCKEKGKKDSEKGVTLQDMFLLSPDKHDDTLSKWRWQAVKQVGNRPSLRSGMSVAVAPNNRVFLFGGVQDVKENEEDLEGNFFNELYTVHVEGEKANWNLVELTGKRDPAADQQKRRRRRKDGEEEGDEDLEEESEESTSQKMDELEIKEKSPQTVTVEEGAFTITSTVGGASSSDPSGSGEKSKPGTDGDNAPFAPCGRFGAALTVKGNNLYLFGGSFEVGDKTITLKDLYVIDHHKLDEWTTLVESDIKGMEWIETDSEEWDSDDDEDDDEDDSEDGEEMETN